LQAKFIKRKIQHTAYDTGRRLFIMHYKRMLLILIFSFFPLFLFSGNASAVAISDTSATLTLDWDSYADIVWSDGSQFAPNGANADLDGVTAVSGFPVDPNRWVLDPVITETATVTADSVGTAQTTWTSASATAHSVADGLGITSPPAENVISSADSNRGRTFSPTRDGEFTFSFEYIISQVFSKEFGTESYSGWSTVQLMLSDSSAGGGQIAYDEVVFNNTGTGGSDSLGFTVALQDKYLHPTAGERDHIYFLMGHVYTSASANSPEQVSPIPEPSTILLFASGMFGLAALRRRMK
jgi:hypothetical protein